MQTDFSAWRGNFCIEVSPIPNTVVIFGASGDLAYKKLLPALFSLYRRKLFHEKSRIVGCARSEMDSNSFRERVKKSLHDAHKGNIDIAMLENFLSIISYAQVQYDDINSFNALAGKLCASENERCSEASRIYYLATPVALYEDIISNLSKSGLLEENYEGYPWRNVVIEKPFGHDLQSAKELDKFLSGTIKERQIYRIDHYLGKETVQNILMMRFANRIFEPLWSNHYIDNVQITSAEAIGIENRAGYYEKAGLLRDMFQNHMLQMLSLVAMEAPSSFEADRVRDEKVKLLSSIRPFAIDKLSENIVRGQYTPGIVNDAPVKGYTEEEGVDPDSQIETFVAARFFIDNWRWQGVPFYVRSGKRMKKRVSEIAITFKRVPHSIFAPIRAEDLAPNTLVLNVQPEEGLALTIQSKQPGPKLCMGNLTMDFKYDQIFQGEKPEAYERLLLDCMLGDQTLFIRSDNILTSWSLLTPVLDAWENEKDSAKTGRLFKYRSGSWGPDESDKLIAKSNTIWRNID